MTDQEFEEHATRIASNPEQAEAVETELVRGDDFSVTLTRDQWLAVVAGISEMTRGHLPTTASQWRSIALLADQAAAGLCQGNCPSFQRELVIIANHNMTQRCRTMASLVDASKKARP